MNLHLVLLVLFSITITESDGAFSFFGKKPQSEGVIQQQQKKSTSVLSTTPVHTRDNSLQYSLLNGDIPPVRSTESSDTLCAAICNRDVLKTCHFDSTCIRKHTPSIPYSSTQQKATHASSITCSKLCSSSATNTVDIAALKKYQLKVIVTNKRKQKYINSNIQSKISNKKYLWATVIVRNSAQKLVEWIIWHFLMGVQHFIIFDNVSVDNINEAMKPFVKANIVTVISNVRDMKQLSAYNHALQLSKRRGVHWLLMMDVDEFIMTSSSNSLLEVLFSHSTNPAIGAIQLQWQFVVPPPKGFLFKPLNVTFLELLTNGFTTDGYSHPRCSTKSIVKVESALEAHIHYSKFQNITTRGEVEVHVRGIDIFGRPIESPWARKPCENGYALNMKNGCKTCMQGFEAKVAEWQCQLNGGAMRRNQAYFTSSLDDMNQTVKVNSGSLRASADESSITIRVPECTPPVKGYMTLQGLDINFVPRPNTVIEALNIGFDSEERLRMMKSVLLLPAQHQWTASIKGF